MSLSYDTRSKLSEKLAGSKFGVPKHARSLAKAATCLRLSESPRKFPQNSRLIDISEAGTSPRDRSHKHHEVPSKGQEVPTKGHDVAVRGHEHHEHGGKNHAAVTVVTQGRGLLDHWKSWQLH